MADIKIKDPFNHKVIAPKRKKVVKPPRWEKAKTVKRRKTQEKHKWCLGRAEAMKKKPTKSEILAMDFLDELNVSYLFQAVVLNYIPDFRLPKKVILEIDGSVHETLDQKAHDFIKDNLLCENGWKVVRITNDELSSSAGFNILQQRLVEVNVKINSVKKKQPLKNSKRYRE